MAIQFVPKAAATSATRSRDTVARNEVPAVPPRNGKAPLAPLVTRQVTQQRTVTAKVTPVTTPVTQGDEALRARVRELEALVERQAAEIARLKSPRLTPAEKQRRYRERKKAGNG